MKNVVSLYKFACTCNTSLHPLQFHTKTLKYYKTLPSSKPNNVFSHHHIVHASLRDDSPSSTPKQTKMGYDPAEELYGLDVNMLPRDAKTDASEPRSWFGPSGQYIKELPCPSCRGRGYTPCAECGIERSRKDCSLCSGKGIMTCKQCLGECVIWEESVDEIPWEKARSSSPLNVKEDDEVDDLDLKLDVRKKSKRVYKSTPEVGLKISRSLKSLNAKTGLFSKRMKIIHSDPALHAQRVAAITKTKRTPAARKQASEALIRFFSDPENRRKRSISMKGTKFFCKNCGQEGHRSNFCPKHGKNHDRRLKCRLCGETGHNRKTCGRPNNPKQRVLQPYHCGACGQVGHNRRTCLVKMEGVLHQHHCTACGQVGHNSRTCPVKTEGVQHQHHCTACGQVGHNSRTCPVKTEGVLHQHHCAACGQVGHNRRTCPVKTEGVQHQHHCTACGQVGHNSRTCPVKTEGVLHQHHCTACGQVGHNSRTCPVMTEGVLHQHHCAACGQVGHNRRTCPVKTEGVLHQHHCTACGQIGHNSRTCPLKTEGVLHQHHCAACGQVGHNRRTCSVKTELKPADGLAHNADLATNSTSHSRHHYRCSICGILGHNRRTCSKKPVERVDVNASESP